jgi:hypothetical protein
VKREHALVPKGQVVIQTKRPKPSYVIRRPGEAPMIAVRRRRAYR